MAQKESIPKSLATKLSSSDWRLIVNLGISGPMKGTVLSCSTVSSIGKVLLLTVDSPVSGKSEKYRIYLKYISILSMYILPTNYKKWWSENNEEPHLLNTEAICKLLNEKKNC